MQALARLQVRHNRIDDQTKRMLEEIALAGETPQWNRWAQQQLARIAGRSHM